MSYKSCVVPLCTSTSIMNPEKLFVNVPYDRKRRKLWLKLARRYPNSISSETKALMCEDHFDMEKDMTNYTMYKMGFSQRILLSDKAVPTKFYCQEDRNRRLSDPCFSRGAFLKRRRIELVAECMQSSSTPTPNLPGVLDHQVETQTKILQQDNEINEPEETDDALNEDMCVIKQEIEIEDDPLDNPMCGACLCQGRSLQPLGPLAAVYCALVPQETDVEAVKICEECAASLRACAMFQKQAVHARKVLRASARGQYTDLHNTEKQSTLPSTSYSSTMPKPKEIGSELAPEVTCAIKVEIDLPEDTSAINEDINIENDPVYEEKYVIKSRECTPKPRKRKKTDDLPRNTEPVPTRPPDANAMCVEIDLQENIDNKELPRRKGPS